MIKTEPQVFLIAKSTPLWSNIQAWLKSLGVSDEKVSRIVADGETHKRPGEALIELCGRRCYKSFEPGLNPNVQRVREDIVKYIDHILETGHGSVCEHAYFSFAIENVSRVFTGEMNRHRAGMAISEGSMRFIRFDEIPFWSPPSIQTAVPPPGGSALDVKKRRTQREIERAVQAAEEVYAAMQEIWKDELSPTSKFADKKNVTSMMRRIVPMGVSTGGVWTGNVRAWRHIFTMRCAEAAEEEIRHVCELMLKVMVIEEPRLFGDFHRGEDGAWAPKHKKV